MNKRILTWMATCVAVMMPAFSFASGYWQAFEGNTAPSEGVQVLKPARFRLYTLDQDGMISFLKGLPAGPEQAVLCTLPSPDGKDMEFLIWETSAMEEGLQRRYPEIRTFTARAVYDPTVTAKIDYTVKGFHAMVYNGEQTYFIDPYADIADGYYLVYYKKDHVREFGNRMACLIKDDNGEIIDGRGAGPSTIDGSVPPVALRLHGSSRKTYRLALSCTGEYAEAVAGPTPTKPAVLSAMVTTMNRVNGIYERELAVTMSLIANTDLLIYLNPATDPFFE